MSPQLTDDNFLIEKMEDEKDNLPHSHFRYKIEMK